MQTSLRALPWLFLTLGLASCEEFGIGVEDGGVVARFEARELPLVPTGFPVYPKAFSTASIGELVDASLRQVTFQTALDDFAGDLCTTVVTVEVCMDELLGASDFAAFDDELTALPQVQSWATDQLSTSLRFFEPGPLGVGVSEQIARTVGGVVSFDAVQLRVRVRNRTDELWAVPLRFSLFMGDSASVVERTALVRDPEAPEAQDFSFLIQPGETRELVLDAPQLVAALNDVRSLSVDYDAVVEVADLDVATFRSWLEADRSDADGNGVADALAGWGLVFEELTISISGRGDVELPGGFPDWMLDRVPEALRL